MLQKKLGIAKQEAARICELHNSHMLLMWAFSSLILGIISALMYYSFSKQSSETVCSLVRVPRIYACTLMSYLLLSIELKFCTHLSPYINCRISNGCSDDLLCSSD